MPCTSGSPHEVLGAGLATAGGVRSPAGTRAVRKSPTVTMTIIATALRPSSRLIISDLLAPAFYKGRCRHDNPGRINVKLTLFCASNQQVFVSTLWTAGISTIRPAIAHSDRCCPAHCTDRSFALQFLIHLKYSRWARLEYDG